MIAEAPPHVETLLAQAMTAYRMGDLTMAETLYGAVQQVSPGEPNSLHILGLMAHQRGDFTMAANLIERAATLHPHSRVQHNLGVVYSEMLEHDAAIANYRRTVALEPDYLDAWANLIFTLDLHPHLTPELLKETRAAFDEVCCLPLTERAAPHENDPDPDRRLRVGYVSGDFNDHSSAMATRNVLAGHDPDAVEVALYMTGTRRDSTTEAFKARADIWCEVADVTDHELAAIIREDQIDILVDLAGFSKGHRLLTFAEKPAPVQITGWGYGCGTGISAMDYMLADAVSVPPEHEDRYRSKVLRLPALLSYAPGEYPDIASSPQERNGYRTYGYFGRAMKLNAPVLAAWAEILRRDATGKLILKGGQFENRVVRDWIGRRLYALGVDPGRVEVVGATLRYDHLAAHNEVDVMLDPFPHGGGSTTLDAALMGVPTVTLMGETIQGRVGASLLTTIGWGTLPSPRVGDYIAMAKDVDCDRQWLRDALLSSIIYHPTDYSRACEAAYREAWRAWVGRAR